MELFAEISYGKRVVVYYSLIFGFWSGVFLFSLFFFSILLAGREFPVFEQTLTVIIILITLWIVWRMLVNLLFFFGILKPNESETYIRDI